MATDPLNPGTARLQYIDALLIILFAIIPLFLHFPYRVNIFLSWEGAYRLYLGQVPYKDFGMPLGFGYWLVPALFFKIFGPYLFSLIKAQVFLNIVAGFSFRGILQKLKVNNGIRIAAVLVFCLSYIMLNFWPWYNNTVIIWELVALNLLLGFIFNTAKTRYLQLVAGCFFLFLSFFTKQDGGALAFLLAAGLLVYHAWHDKRWIDLLLFFACYAAISLLIILPFTRYDFGYWFNHGQPPHSSRVSVMDLLNEILGESQWIKFYVLLAVLLLLGKINRQSKAWQNKQFVLFLLLTTGILLEAAIFQVTSYTPPDNNIFFHSFAIAFIISLLADVATVNFAKRFNLLALTAVVLLWWSGMYWRYIDRIAMRIFPPAPTAAAAAGGENIINRHTYMINTDTTHYEDESTWTAVPGSKAFNKMYLPPSTVAGIQRLKQMPLLSKKDKRILNMTELTPLEYELGCEPEKERDFPLWFHLGVSMFNRQVDSFSAKIRRRQYDMVLFEYVPVLNNFYPFRLRDSLQTHYHKIDSFSAPRRPTNGVIEIYVK